MPSLARDMKQPEKFDRVVNWAFVSLAIISCPLSESVWSYSKTFFFFFKKERFFDSGLDTGDSNWHIFHSRCRWISYVR